MQGQGDQAITAYYLYDVCYEKIWPKRVDWLIYILDAGIPGTGLPLWQGFPLFLIVGQEFHQRHY